MAPPALRVAQGEDQIVQVLGQRLGAIAVLEVATGRVLALAAKDRPAVFEVAPNAIGLTGHPGFKTAMAEDLIMEFEEIPEDAALQLETLRPLQPVLEDELVPIMTGLVQCTSLMSSPKAAGELDAQVV